jgi:hypothetical protein
MTHTNQAGLQIILRNPEPKPEVHYSRTWILCARNHQDLRILVSRDGANQPRIIRKEAA